MCTIFFSNFRKKSLQIVNKEQKETLHRVTTFGEHFERIQYDKGNLHTSFHVSKQGNFFHGIHVQHAIFPLMNRNSLTVTSTKFILVTVIAIKK